MSPLDRPGLVLRPPLSAAHVAAYLRVLAVAPAPPSRTALAELVASQVTRVPFENLSKLRIHRTRGRAGIPELEEYLDGIERYRLGGTCYANNVHFCRLLQALGYPAALCGADMPSGPDVHAAITLTLEGSDLLVDVGFAAPFLAPLPRDRADDVVVSWGRDRYVLRPRDGAGRSRLDHHRDGAPLHGYLLRPQARPVDHFRSAVEASFAPGATFMNAVMIVRYWPDRSVAVHNNTLVRSTPDRSTVEQLSGRAELVEAIERELGIPAAITRDAIEDLGPLGDVYG